MAIISTHFVEKLNGKQLCRKWDLFSRGRAKFAQSSCGACAVTSQSGGTWNNNNSSSDNNSEKTLREDSTHFGSD